jgi:hypothetical protein
MASPSVCVKVGRYSVPGRRAPFLFFAALQHLELARTVKLHRLPPQIRNRHGLTACFIPNPELVFLLRHFTYAYRKLARFIVNGSLDDQAVSQVAVCALIE